MPRNFIVNNNNLPTPFERRCSFLLLDDVIKDSSISKINLTNNGVVVSDTPNSPFGQKSFYFTNDSIFSTSNSFVFGYDDFTVDVYVYITSQPASLEQWCILNTDKVSNNGFALYITSGGGLRAMIAGYLSIDFGFSNTIPINTWTHISFVRKGGSGYIYTNGQIRADGGNASANLLTSNLYIGVDNGDTNYFPGYMAGLKISNSALHIGSSFDYLASYYEQKAPFLYNLNGPISLRGKNAAYKISKS
jgi:hypothetical protein